MSWRQEKRDYQCKGPHMKFMLLIKPSLSRCLLLPQERILYSAQVKSFSLNKTFVFKLLAIPIMWLNKTHQMKPIPV